MLDILKKRIAVAKGDMPADLVVKGGRVVNLFSGRIGKTDVAISDGYIAGLGEAYKGDEEVDISGRFLVPGFIEGHIHIESTMLVPSELAPSLLMAGTTCIVADPHEIANVKGVEGISFMLDDSRSIPFDIFFTAPSCVPSTHLETAGAELGIQALTEIKKDSRILGLAEMMNYPGVIGLDKNVLEKISVFDGEVIDGHAPLLSGRNLQAYVTSGIRSEHETTLYREALEKLEAGMMIMIREGSSARNMKALIPLVADLGSRRFCLVSDDLHAGDIVKRGHLNYLLKKAVSLGLDPVEALRMVTLNPAEYFGLRKRGAVAPGFKADLTVLENLNEFVVKSVFKDGIQVVRDGQLKGYPEKRQAGGDTEPLNIKGLSSGSFQIPVQGEKALIIKVIPGQIETETILEEVHSEGGMVVSDTDSDTLKLFVIERHNGSGRIGRGLVRGFGLRQGAIASSVAHDSHNVIALGVDDHDIYRAVEEVRLIGGGLTVAVDGKIVASVPLTVAGLMSREPIDRLVGRLKELKRVVWGLGCSLEEPLGTLSFLALPVIPELKLTDMGLVDVMNFRTVPLFPRNR